MLIQRILRVLIASAAAYIVLLIAGYVFRIHDVRRHHIESASFLLAALVLARCFPWTFDDRPIVKPRAALVAAVAVAGVALYWRTLGIGFLSDDFVLKAWVEAGQLSWVNSQFVRPVALAVWRVVFILGGAAGTLHTLNLAVHIVNTMLASVLAARLGLGPAGVWIATLVFLAWPTQVEPVAWASGIFDVLSATWMLSALLLVSTPAETARPVSLRAMGLCLFTVLALLTKESAVALPLLALLIAAPNRPAIARRRALVLCAWVAALTALYLGSRLLIGAPVAGTATLSRYMVKEQLSRTVGAFAVPVSDETIQGDPALAFFVAAGLVVLMTLSFVARERRSPSHVRAALGLVWSVIAAIPTLGVLFIGPYLDGSRYLYVATFGWGVTLAALADSVSFRPLFRIVTAIVTLGTLAVAISEQQARLSDWQNAAGERDRIIADAVRLAKELRCGEVTAANLPPRFKGAQLFTNGFAEAFGAARGAPVGQGTCAFEWNGTSFLERRATLQNVVR